MSTNHLRRVGTVPPERAFAPPPRVRPLAAAPKLLGQTPIGEPTRAPRQRPVAKPPNPRRPKLVHDADGGELMDLFAVFPDLPRPPRTASRMLRTVARRRLMGPR